MATGDSSSGNRHQPSQPLPANSQSVAKTSSSAPEIQHLLDWLGNLEILADHQSSVPESPVQSLPSQPKTTLDLKSSLNSPQKQLAQAPQSRKKSSFKPRFTPFKFQSQAAQSSRNPTQDSASSNSPVSNFLSDAVPEWLNLLDTLPAPSVEIVPLSKDNQPSRQSFNIAQEVSQEVVSSIVPSELENRLQQLEVKLEDLADKLHHPTDLVNPLIPLIAELLELKIEGAEGNIMERITPILDQAIRRRSEEDAEAMSAALSIIIPSAISQKIQDSPEEIAKAIAPEIAVAIEEQIRLERDSISKALAPEMGRAIKAQIELERDAMVDALYPVIGNTISKYMVEAIREINAKVENTLSIQGLQRKVRAKVQGISEAELILRESIRFTVQAVFLIQKASGLMIAEAQPEGEFRLESEMIAGMLTAIRSFVNDCISQNEMVSEIHEIEYGDSRIMIEVAGYCYLAVIVQGLPSKELQQKVRSTLEYLVQKHDRILEEFDGDPTTIPDIIPELLNALLQTNQPETEAKPPTTLLVLLALLIAAIALPLGFFGYRQQQANRLENLVAESLSSTPQLAVYRLTPEVEGQSVILKGKLPTEALRAQAEQLAQQALPQLKVENQIIAVEVPPDPTLVAAEVQRLGRSLSQQPNTLLLTRFQEQQVIVQGFAPQDLTEKRIIQSFAQIPGVKSVIIRLQPQPPVLSDRIYFDSGSTVPNAQDVTQTLPLLQQFLQQYPEAHLKIIGHVDLWGNLEQNRLLSQQRADGVKKMLIEAGIEAKRLETQGIPTPPPNQPSDASPALSRCVRFEVFIPLEKS